MMDSELQNEIISLRRDWLLLKAVIMQLEHKMLSHKKSSDDSEPWNGSDDEDFDEDDIDTGDILPAKDVPDNQGRKPYVGNIFIGGALDKDQNGNVLKSDSLRSEVYGKNYYATYADKDKILAQIDALPPGMKVNLIGHSWGADTAARVALERPGRINALVTIDPVTTFGTKPDFTKLSSSVGTWADINATGKPDSSILDDIFNGNAAAGLLNGAWGNQIQKYADYYSDSGYNHADFDAMMRAPFSNGMSSQQMINNGL